MLLFFLAQQTRWGALRAGFFQLTLRACCASMDDVAEVQVAGAEDIPESVQTGDVENIPEDLPVREKDLPESEK